MVKFKAGDLVKHKTGVGPKMAVEGYDQAGSVMCKWYDTKKKEWKRETFVEEELQLAKETPAPRARGYKTL